MKWIGQHIYDLVARFRNDVYLEDLSTTTETNVLVVDSTGKVSKTTVITGDVTGITEGDNITVTDPTGPVPTVALSTNVDVAGTLDVTGLGTFDGSITVASNVGIGTTSPSTFLQVSGQGNRAGGNIQMGLSSGGVGSKWSYLTGTHYNSTTEPEGFALIGGYSSIDENRVVIGGQIWETNPSTSIQFFTHSSTTNTQGGSERMRITSGGNVGIGTTSPNRKLTVQSSSYSFPSGIDSNSFFAIAQNNWSGMTLLASTTTGSFIDFGDTDAGLRGRILYAHNGDYMSFSTAATERMRITSAGDVGIGTTNPKQSLQIGKTNSNNWVRLDRTSTSYEQAFQWTTGNPNGGTTGDWFFGQRNVSPQTSLKIYDYGKGGEVLTFEANGNAYLTPTGNVGIGTTSPDTPLFVQGGASGTGGWNRTATLSATYPGLIFNSNGTKWGGMAYDYSAAMRFWVNANNNDIFAGTLAMSITNAGNVGIGTTSPGYKLDVDGSINGTSLYVNTVDQNSSLRYSAPNNKVSFARTSTSDEWFKIIAGGGSPVTHRISITSSGDNTNMADEYLVNTAGYGFYLHIQRLPGVRYNTSKLVAIAAVNPSNGGSTEIWIKLLGMASGSGTTVIASNTTIRTSAEILASATTTAPTLTSNDTQLDITTDNRNNATLMTSRGAIFGGNVGIGTSSPAQKLDVVGKISLKDAGDSIFVGYEAGLNDDASANLNVGVGYQALRANTTGANNTAHGFRALYSNTTGAGNSAVGRTAMYLNTTGANNSAFGLSALTLNTTGANNSGFGQGALQTNTTGTNNTAHGLQALYSNTTASGNTAIGTNALFLNTTGANNTAHGYQALYSNTTASSNTATGLEALRQNTTGANNTAYGFKALRQSSTANNNTALGYASLHDNTTGSGNVASGHNSLRFNTTGSNNTANGYEALYSNTVGSQTAVGYQALYSNTTGASNSAHAYRALYSNTTGSYNVATGPNALYSNTTGIWNVATGTSALQFNTTGQANTAYGHQALYKNTTGANNTAVGIFSSEKGTTGVGNAALGYAALYENTTGSSNTAIGREAGRFIADGTTANTYTSNSVFLGYNTKALATGQTNQIVIGDTAVGLGSNTAILGNSSITKTQLQGNVGIGTASPTAKLDISQGAGATAQNVINSGEVAFRFSTKVEDTSINTVVFRQGLYYNDTENATIAFYRGGSSIGGFMTFQTHGGNEKMRIDNSGKVGIGTTSPQNKLDIVGSLGRGAPVTKTTDFTVAATENWLIMNGTATITITLPTASSFTGRELMIKNIAAYTVISASSNVKPIDTDNAATAILPATAGSWCTLVSDGTNWVTMMN
jgi:hypothetical protein